jgi:hypothetical protein
MLVVKLSLLHCKKIKFIQAFRAQTQRRGAECAPLRSARETRHHTGLITTRQLCPQRTRSRRKCMQPPRDEASRAPGGTMHTHPFRAATSGAAW